MRKFLSSFILAALLAVTAQAQSLGNVVTDYGKWSATSNNSTAAGAATITIRGFGGYTTPGGKSFVPFSTAAPITVGRGSAVEETVTPSAVSCPAGHQENTCTVTATFSNAHGSLSRIDSGTFGLCEAINDVATGAGVVFVPSGWAGTSSTITSATLGGACDQTDVDVVDMRTGAFISWHSVGGVYTGGGGAVNGATVSEVDRAAGQIHTSVLTLTATPLTVTDALAYAGVKIYDFPEGRILVLGSTGSLAFTTTSTIASTINSGAGLDWSLGTVTASSETLASTMVDILPKVDNPSSTVINVAAAATTGALAASAQFDGTSTAKDVFLNVGFPTTTDIDADGTLTITGTITITWIQLGDF